MGLFMKNNHFLRRSSKLDWGAGIVSIDKTAYKEIGALIRSLKFLSSEVEF